MADTIAGAAAEHPGRTVKGFPNIDGDVQSSGIIGVTAGLAVSDQPCYAVGIDIIPAAANVSVTIYDNASAASGTEVHKSLTLLSTKSVHIDLENTLCKNGMFIVTTGAGLEVIARFRR